MNTGKETQNAENNINPPSSGSVGARPAGTHSINLSVGGAIKSEKVQPIFRLIESYDKRKLLSKATNTTTMPAKTADEYASSLEERKKNGSLYAEASEPVWHKITNPMITAPIIAENLHLPFKDLPLTGAPEDLSRLEEHEDQLIREYVGFDLDETEYEELENYCNPENLKTGDEIQMSTSFPVTGLLGRIPENAHDDKSDDGNSEKQTDDDAPELWTLKRLRKRQKLDSEKNAFPKLLKYRGVYQIPLKDKESSKQPPDLTPGKDVLYRIRVYRPFYTPSTIDKISRTRHSVFLCDIAATSRTPLCALRDRFECRNDLDMRLDLSNNPDVPSSASAKTVFPSGFFFINNVFYVDGRVGCHDTSAGVRRWAQQRGLGTFPVRRMDTLCVGDVLLRLAHPEVYVHQGNCEHLFLFSEMRLLTRSDPLHRSTYPCHTLTSQNQSIYCTTCVEFTAKWLVTGSDRVPFDPAFFCDACFKEYMYRGGRKVGHFKAYAYRGNEINIKNAVPTNYKMVLDYN